MNHFSIIHIKKIIDNIHKPLLYMLCWAISLLVWIIILMLINQNVINFYYIWIGPPLMLVGLYAVLKITKE